MRLERIYVPTEYQIITKEDVKRWQAMEQRLDMLLEAHSKAVPEGDLSRKIQEVLLSSLQFVRDGKDNGS